MPENELLDKKIQEYHSLKQQQKQLTERIEHLKKYIKKELGPKIIYIVGDLVVYTEPRHKVTNIDQCAIDDLFESKNIFEKYAEFQIPDEAIDYAHQAKDITDQELEFLRNVDTTIALLVEKRGDYVQSKNDILSEW